MSSVLVGLGPDGRRPGIITQLHQRKLIAGPIASYRWMNEIALIRMGGLFTDYCRTEWTNFPSAATNAWVMTVVRIDVGGVFSTNETKVRKNVTLYG